MLELLHTLLLRTLPVQANFLQRRITPTKLFWDRLDG